MTDFYSLTQPGRPLVIAHKGHSSILPENTTEAIILALHYADLAELDVMLTYDREMVVFHDNFLSRMTNVADCPEFAHKKR
jgi:glycerophosphoryl diester phosphodiesterase